MNIEKPFDEVTSFDIRRAIAFADNDYTTDTKLPIIRIDGTSYVVIESDEVARATAKIFAEESLQYTSLDFMAEQCNLPVELFEALSNSSVKESTLADIYRTLIERETTMDDFLEEMIDCDGEEHFLEHVYGEVQYIDEYRLYEWD